MPIKDSEKRREYRMKWYFNHKKSEKAHVKKRKLEIRKWFNELKADLKCSICFERHPAIIDFHHERNENKEHEIAQMIGDGYSVERIKKEIDKCKVVCSNCHRKIHFKNSNLLKHKLNN